MCKMSEAGAPRQNIKHIEFEAIVPDTGELFFEECPKEHEIERPRLLPLKSTTQLRFEQLQYEASRQWKERQKTTKKTADKTN